MNEVFDCLIIGYNEMDISRYLNYIRLMGGGSGEYEYFKRSCVFIDKKPYALSDICNKIVEDNKILYNEYDFFQKEVALLASALIKSGCRIEIINSFQQNKNQIISYLTDGYTKSVLIPTGLYNSIVPISDMVALIRQYSTDIPIILSGNVIASETNNQSEQYVQSVLKNIGGDYYITSAEPDKDVTGVLNHIRGLDTIDQINNLYYRNGELFHKTQCSADNTDIDDTVIDWTLFEDKLNGPVFTKTSLSCPFSCEFCSHPRNGIKYQSMSIQAVERELDSIASCNGVRTVFFSDDTFNVPLSRFKSILDLIISKNYSFNWFSFIRCQYLDEETVALMKKSKCKGVYLGIESGDQEMLDRMNKNVKLAEYRHGIELLKKYDILVIASFIVGFPGENDSSINNTINFINDIDPDFVIPLLWFYSKRSPVESKKDIFQIQGNGYNWKHSTMDSKEALQYMDKMLLNIEKSVCVPDLRFSYKGIITLLDKGIPISILKYLIGIFNEARKDRIIQETINVSQTMIEKLRIINWEE